MVGVFVRTYSDELSARLAHVFSRCNGVGHSLLFPKAETCIRRDTYSHSLSLVLQLSLKRSLGRRQRQAASVSCLVEALMGVSLRQTSSPRTRTTEGHSVRLAFISELVGSVNSFVFRLVSSRGS